ncbi:DUF4097 family beta strand repeat-containing protein [Winogradskyella flava]|uniref:DUF4097 family beta strand repeat-containing protein n=1 Tax=Winogradskyella flava TaxID=1884876 RepID=UPI002492F75F|nr:DUF4097 family beta strand repeat-containing protein [Winogradskyella flava]
MKLKKPIALITIIFLIFDGFSQDYVHSTNDIDKVEIIANTTIILKTHNNPSLLISDSENKRIKKGALGLKPTFGKDNTDFNVFVEQNNSTLRVESFQPRIADPLVIYLPETIKISVESRINNDINISDFKNEVEAKTNRGDIKIINVKGPVIVENARGNTFIVFEEVSQNSPISIINSHGDIDITIPENTKADIEVSVPRGELYTDLELISVENSEEEEDKMRSTRTIKSKLNYGGVSIMIVASLGNIYLRKE